MQIVWIGECPQTVPTLARWHVDAFGEMIDEWLFEEASFELRTHVAKRAVPTTLVALEAGQALGSVSLLDSDWPAPDRYAPWLGTLYVKPEARGRGIGAALIRAAVEEAAALDVPQLHLWTPEHAEFYLKLGWESLGAYRFGDLDVSLMRIDCRAA
jgi:GNAT superfamily N-acetyltransferase